MSARIALALILACAACSTTEGNVLTTVGGGDGGNNGDGDGGNDDGDGGPGTDAIPVCSVDGPCTTPMPGDSTLCGRVIDIETSEPITADAVEIPDVRIFDLLEFTTNPGNADAIAEVTPDECGWFDVTFDTVLGFTMIHTGNPDLTDSSPFINVATRVDVGAGQIVRVNAYAVRDDVDDAWSASANLGGNTFGDGGAIVVVYVDVTATPIGPLQGSPVSSVTLDVSGPIPGGVDYYIADSGQLTRTSVDTNATSTLTSGTAILLGPPSLSTIGGDHPSCSFDDITALSLPGLIQVQELDGTCN